MQSNTKESEPIKNPLDDILSQGAFQQKYADKFSKGQIVWFLRNRDRNGLSKSGAVILSARKFYISEKKFAEWFAKQTA